MKIYLASRYSRNAEMREVRDLLHSSGHSVTSKWIDLHIETGDILEQSFTPEFLSKEPQTCSVYGQEDFDNIKEADVVVSFTSLNGGGKGGRHVEFGIALGLGKRSIIVGPRENIFHTLENIEVVNSVDELVDILG